METDTMGHVARVINSLFQVRRGEWARVVFFGGHVGLAVAAVIILKSLNDAVFLGTYDSSLLPYAFMAAAIVMSAASAAYGSLLDRIPRGRLTRLTLFVFVAVLAACGLLGRLPLRGFVFVQYVVIWVIAGLMVSLGWQFALSGFDTRESKRLAPLLGAMSTTGAMAGGIATRIVSQRFGVPWLLLLCIGLLGALILLSPKRMEEEGPDMPHGVGGKGGFLKNVNKGFDLIRRNDLMLWLTVVVALGVLAGTFIDYQFKSSLRRQFNTNEIGAFLGSFYFLVNLLVLFVQLFVTSRLMNRFGLTGAVTSMPAALAAVSAACLIHPVFWAFAAMGFLDKLVSPSWYRAGIFQVFGPVPMQRVARIKLTLDGVIAPLSCLVASGVLLVLIPVLPYDRLTWVLLGLCIAWLLAARRLKPGYVRELARSIQHHALTLQTETARLDAVDQDLLALLIEDLKADAVERIEFALCIVRETRARQLFSAVHPLLDHPDPSIQTSAMDTLVLLDKARASDVLRKRLREGASAKSTAYLLRCLTEAGDTAALPLTEDLLEAGDPGVRAEAAVLLFRLGGLDGIVTAVTALSSLAKGSDAERAAASTFIERVGLPVLDHALVGLLEDAKKEVRIAALRAACHVHSEKVIQRLIVSLSDHELHEYAEQALLASGASAREFFRNVFSQSPPPAHLIATVTHVFEAAPDAGSFAMLQSWLESESPELRYHAIKALAHLCGAGFPPEKAAIERFLASELRTSYVLAVLIEQSTEVIRKELQHRYRQCLVQILFGLSTRHDREGIYNVRTAVLSNDSRLKANAIEYLDATLTEPVLRLAITLLEGIPARDKYGRARALLDLEPIDGLSLEKIAQTDKWLAALTGVRQSPDLDSARVALARALAQCPLFEGLAFETLYAIAGRGEMRTYAPGACLFQEGDPASYYVVVLKGCVEIGIRGRLAGTVAVGGGFGEAGMLLGGLRIASARSREQTECFLLPKEQFEYLVCTDLEFSQGVTGFMVRMVRAATDREGQLKQRLKGPSVV